VVTPPVGCHRCLVLVPKERANCRELRSHEYIAELAQEAEGSNTMGHSHKSKNFASVSNLTFEPTSTYNINELLAKADAAEQAEFFNPNVSVASAGGIYLNETAGSQFNMTSASRGPFATAVVADSYDDEEFMDALAESNKNSNIGTNTNERPKTCPAPKSTKSGLSSNSGSIKNREDFVDGDNDRSNNGGTMMFRNTVAVPTYASNKNKYTMNDSDDDEGSSNYMDYFESKK
jgi:hypothetical protein